MCGGQLDISGTPEIVDRFSQGMCVMLTVTAQQSYRVLWVIKLCSQCDEDLTEVVCAGNEQLYMRRDQNKQ